MKHLLPAFGIACLASCSAHREIEADFVAATLVKIEVVKRYQGNEKMFTWKTAKDITYITYEPNYVNIPIGTVTRVLIQK